MPGTSEGTTWSSGTRGCHYSPGPSAREVGLWKAYPNLAEPTLEASACSSEGQSNGPACGLCQLIIRASFCWTGCVLCSGVKWPGSSSQWGWYSVDPQTSIWLIKHKHLLGFGLACGRLQSGKGWRRGEARQRRQQG